MTEVQHNIQETTTASAPKPTIRLYIEIIVLSFVAALLIKCFIIDAVVVPSHSMESTLLVGDFVFVNKLIYGTTSSLHLPFTHALFPGIHLPGISDIHRGDVIVFEFPEEQHPHAMYFVKRCVALGGDKVMIENGAVYVNGVPISLPDDDRGAMQAQHIQTGGCGPILVPKRGDVIHVTPQNYDQWETLIRREGHTIERSGLSDVYIDGSLTGTYTVEQNYLFVLGDNTNESYDSRHWGLLPQTNVLGKAMMVYWSRNMLSPVRNLLDVVASVRWNRIGTLVR